MMTARKKKKSSSSIPGQKLFEEIVSIKASLSARTHQQKLNNTYLMMTRIPSTEVNRFSCIYCIKHTHTDKFHLIFESLTCYSMVTYKLVIYQLCKYFYLQ